MKTLHALRVECEAPHDLVMILCTRNRDSIVIISGIQNHKLWLVIRMQESRSWLGHIKFTFRFGMRID